MPSWLPWRVRNRLTGEQLSLLCCAFPFAALLQLGVVEEAVTQVSIMHQQSCTKEQDWVEGSRHVSSVLCVLCGTGKQLWKLCKQLWNLSPVRIILRVWLVPYWQPHCSTPRQSPQPQARSALPSFCLLSPLHKLSAAL